MASKWHKKTCPICMEGVLYDGVREQEMEYKGQVYHYTAKGAFCDHCHDGFAAHDPKEESRWAKFRDQIDVEEIAELARIRKKLKLTQQQAAALAGGGKNAFSRYERGQAKPVHAVINLFRLLDKHPELLNELRTSN